MRKQTTGAVAAMHLRLDSYRLSLIFGPRLDCLAQYYEKYKFRVPMELTHAKPDLQSQCAGPHWPIIQYPCPHRGNARAMDVPGVNLSVKFMFSQRITKSGSTPVGIARQELQTPQHILWYPPMCNNLTNFAQDLMLTRSGRAGKSTMGKPMPRTLTDRRQIIPLAEAGTTIISEEISQNVASLQGIRDALALGDMPTMAEATAKSGG